jgi:site-specific DNA-methyltransferase (adenine-specific)
MRVETGDGWELRCGDCLDEVDGLPSIGEVDHVITDPPYEAEAHTLQRRQVRGTKSSRSGDEQRIRTEPIPFAAITEDVRTGVGAAIGAAARRWALVFCQVEAINAWRTALDPLIYKRACLWLKPDGCPQWSGDRPGQGYETIVATHAKGRSRWNGGGKLGQYRFEVGKTARRISHHPTMKPMLLMESLVRDFTDPGDLVCDPFAGSATTGVACIRLGRRFIGWEKDPEFFATAVKRLRGAAPQGDLFEPTIPRVKPKLLTLPGMDS